MFYYALYASGVDASAGHAGHRNALRVIHFGHPRNYIFLVFLLLYLYAGHAGHTLRWTMQNLKRVGVYGGVYIGAFIKSRKYDPHDPQTPLKRPQPSIHQHLTRAGHEFCMTRITRDDPR